MKKDAIIVSGRNNTIFYQAKTEFINISCTNTLNILRRKCGYLFPPDEGCASLLQTEIFVEYLRIW